MLRVQQRWEIAYGHFADFLAQLEEVNAVRRARGWVLHTPR